ncbi:MAG TPA: tetratricopeptide repeat protein, partial [Thermomicrobiales bacterium]|nr:tetratricopeptide repeat protein [Thermomicrobiales bacterium]
FALTEANAADVVAICRRLDGLPLALELAAAWSKMLPPHALRPRLEARSLALTRGARDLPARQQTLRATLTWSHDLLEPEERTLLRRLAVFAGGCTIEAAEAVVDHAGDLGLDPLDGLARLVDKSLAIETAGDDAFPRFGMYETVREFALEQLAASGEEAALRTAHAHCFLALAEAAEPELEGANEGVWLDRLEIDHPNLRAALRWSFDCGDRETALRIGAALSRFWWLRGHLSEGRAWLESALANAGDVSPRIVVKAMVEAGYHAYFAGDLERASHWYGEALAISRTNDDSIAAVRALNGLGNLARQQGELDEAASRYGDALGLARSLGDPRIVARVLGNLGFLVARRGAFGESQALLEENLDLARRLGDQAHECATLSALGDVALAAGDPIEAAARYRAGFALSRQIGDLFIIAECLAGMASVARRSGRAELAARLLGGATALTDRLGAPRDHTLPDLHRATEDEMRRALGGAAFRAAHDAGRARSLDDAEADLLAFDSD